MVPVATSLDLPEAMRLIGYSLMTEHGRGTNADTLLQAMEASNGQCGLKDSSVAWTCPTPILTSETCHPILLPAHSRPQCQACAVAQGSSAFSGSLPFLRHSCFRQ